MNGATSLATPVHAEERRSSSAPAGALTQGMSASLQGPQNAVHIGEPIPITVEMRNSSQRNLQLKLGTRRRSYVFLVVDESSNAIVELRPTPKVVGSVVGGPSAGRALASGFSHYIDFNLADFVDIQKPGKYRVTVTPSLFIVDQAGSITADSTHALKLQPSNAIEITILP